MPATPSGPHVPARVSFGDAVRFWLELGFISFGGPAGQIAIMHRELVERRQWISDRRFLHALNYCMLLPGPEAQQLATYIGWLLHRTWGGVVAGTLFVLPSLVLLIALSWIYVDFGHTPIVAGLFYGVKPAVTAIVLEAVHRIGRRTLLSVTTWIIAAVAFVTLAGGFAGFPVIILGAAVAGAAIGRLWPDQLRVGGHGPAPAHAATAVIDDHTALVDHTRVEWRRTLRTVVLGVLLWATPLAALATTLGGSHVLTQMAWFFTKAALLTFGGAYAVLPYVYLGAVTEFEWLTAPQMIDGLALGETTPGPLIMVVAFVGFVGAHGADALGWGLPGLSGVVGAVVVTWFTFLPSFLFILLGAPIVEQTRGVVRLTAPLSAITAAVVGVILNLAIFFGVHVLWPASKAGAFDPAAALLAVVAAVALLVYRVHVVPVIIASALAGLAMASIGL